LTEYFYVIFLSKLSFCSSILCSSFLTRISTKDAVLYEFFFGYHSSSSSIVMYEHLLGDTTKRNLFDISSFLLTHHVTYPVAANSPLSFIGLSPYSDFIS